CELPPYVTEEATHGAAERSAVRLAASAADAAADLAFACVAGAFLLDCLGRRGRIAGACLARELPSLDFVLGVALALPIDARAVLLIPFVVIASVLHTSKGRPERARGRVSAGATPPRLRARRPCASDLAVCRTASCPCRRPAAP